MPRGIVLFCVVGLVLSHSVVALERPTPVSPGGAIPARVESRCPTFSWGLVPEAESYELVVYRFDERGSAAELVLEESLPGSVGSWTPSLDRCFERGGS